MKLRGGAYDGWEGECDETPAERLVAWRCSVRCDGHMCFNVENPAIVLRTAETYKRVECDPEERVAVYEIGNGLGGPLRWSEERELVGAGAGSDLHGPGSGEGRDYLADP